MSKGIRPFSSGTEFEAWRLYNCEHCAKNTTEEEAWGPRKGMPLKCDLDQALLESYFDDGTVSAEVASRIRRPEGVRCGEFEAGRRSVEVKP